MRKGYAPRKVFSIDELLVACWCESELHHVPRALILAGQTVSCGARQCHGPEAA